MSDAQTGIETSARSVLKRAVELDTSKRFTESLICYQEGIQLLLVSLKGLTQKDESKKEGIRKRITEYMDRAEKIKQYVASEKEKSQYHEQIQIENNSTGHSYEKIFGRFLTEEVTKVEVQDPYIRSIHQIYNFLRLCELLIKSNCSIKTIRLKTGKDLNNDQQENKLQEIYTSLKKYNIYLEIEYSPSLHDREIRFNNGWVIKIGRGLDYFKACDSKFSIGYCDFDLRPCHETTIDIFHRKCIQTSLTH